VRLTQREFANLVGSNEHEVRLLVRERVLPKLEGRACYDETHVRAYVDHLRSTLPQTQATPELVGLQISMQRQKLHALERENRVNDRAYAPTELLYEYAKKLGSVVKSAFEAIPGQIKKQIPHLRAAEISIIRTELAKAANAIADFEVG
jgi:phage terminase Nu1 subunit (DNA packaging protein)